MQARASPSLTYTGSQIPLQRHRQIPLRNTLKSPLDIPQGPR